MGAAGFVGSALVKTLAARGGSVLALTRRDIDLLAPDAQDKLASMLRPDDTFVAVAARAPCKNVQMLTENMKISREHGWGADQIACQPSREH